MSAVCLHLFIEFQLFVYIYLLNFSCLFTFLHFFFIFQENENPPPTGLRASPNPSLPAPAPRAPSPQLIPRPPPTFHDTRPEQAAAEQEIARQNAAALDDLVPVIPRLTQLQPPADRRDRPDSLYTPKADLALPDLVPAAKKLNNATRYQKQKPYR